MGREAQSRHDAVRLADREEDTLDVSLSRSLYRLKMKIQIRL